MRDPLAAVLVILGLLLFLAGAGLIALGVSK